jgi:hypothetical protein
MDHELVAASEGHKFGLEASATTASAPPPRKPRAWAALAAAVVVTWLVVFKSAYACCGRGRREGYAAVDVAAAAAGVR